MSFLKLFDHAYLTKSYFIGSIVISETSFIDGDKMVPPRTLILDYPPFLRESVRMSTQVQPLIDYLQQLQRKGETHVHLDETARKVMREFFLVAKGYKKLTPAPTDTTSTQQVKITGPKLQALSRTLAVCDG